MTSASNQSPADQAAPDLILLALFQSRLRERSLYLGQVIQSQRNRRADDASDAEKASMFRAEQALAAVQEAQERIGRGRYGLCEDCKQPIGWDELLESPEQTVCRACDPLSLRESIGLKS